MTNKTTRSDHGFGTIGLCIVLVPLILLTVVSLEVYKQHTKSSAVTVSSTNIVNTKTSTPTNPTSNWTKVNSFSNTYSVRIPDGWALTNYPGGTINGDSITFSAGVPGVVSTASVPYGGDQKKFNVVLTDKQYAAPQWQSPSEYGTEATSDYSIGSLSGKRYSIVYTQTVSGVTKEDKIYQYVFNLSSGKQLTIVYMQSYSDPDNLIVVEQAIQTIELN